MATNNDITGDRLVTGVPSKEYLDNYDKIFSKKTPCNNCGQVREFCDNLTCPKNQGDLFSDSTS